ncbi:PREDICTED: uncharacterized protein LOC106809932 [Priapulus caudatus]|uniref:Uncharacterized protein LOC106809932 n=1 Tax=Priapulus caudatus TaxID=37621 RepID=A0ABM1E8Y5_PRICU|nr:PREDICTED: uncharacterized protein LOC106809932 [Priapulus caudatus]
MWKEGYRYHDTEDTPPNNDWSDELHFFGYYGRNNMEQHFCMKVQPTTSKDRWPVGRYCIFRAAGSPCPVGLSEGWIYWDDESLGNDNEVAGVVPHGVYDSNTKIWYCCKSDGNTDDPIALPTEKPFYLFKHGDACQQVRGMTVSEEWFEWDCEDDIFPKSDYYGSVPTSEIDRNVKIYYCYYDRE